MGSERPTNRLCVMHGSAVRAGKQRAGMQRAGMQRAGMQRACADSMCRQHVQTACAELAYLGDSAYGRLRNADPHKTVSVSVRTMPLAA
jgi:hypothetical protein